jgi:hypothetical protein
VGRLGRHDRRGRDSSIGRARGKRADRIAEFAQSDYGQNLGWLYSHVGVSGPTEFGRLPLGDQRYWIEWYEEAVKRADDGDKEHLLKNGRL